jgi:F0F1-type ATP synthase beta subunit
MSTNSVGFVTKIIGPVLDIKFSLGGLLKIYNAIDITMPDESIVKFLKQ